MSRIEEMHGRTPSAEISRQGHELESKELIEKARDFCIKLRDRQSFDKEPKVAIVTAHADDEVIGYGTVLSQLPNALTIQVTDSTPKVPVSIGDFKTVDEFKAYIKETRRNELEVAMNLAGHNPYRRECFGISDQDVMNNISRVATQLVERFERDGTEFVMTHGYEGGHPDHDSVTAAVHLAKDVLARKGIWLVIIETPLYKGVPGDQKQRTWQEFADGVYVPPEDTFTKKLSPEEVDHKRKLYAAHASQAHVFLKTKDTEELFRIAPNYDFNIPPNNGHVTDIFPEFGLTMGKWRTLIEEARSTLGL